MSSRARPIVFGCIVLVLLSVTMASARDRSVFPTGTVPCDVAFSPEGRLLYSVGDRGSLRIWDVAEGKLLDGWAGPADELYCVAVSPDGKQVIAGGNVRPFFQAWDVGTGHIRFPKQHTAVVSGVAYQPTGQPVSADMDGKVCVWNKSISIVQQTFEVAAGETQIAATDDGWVLIGDSSGTLHAWNPASGESSRRKLHEKRVDAIAVSRQRNRVASLDLTGTVCVSEWPGLKPIKTFTVDRRSENLEFTADGRHLVISQAFGLGIFDAQSGQETAAFTKDNWPGHVNGLTLSPDGRIVAVADRERCIRLVDLDSRARPSNLVPKQVLQSRDTKLYSLRYTPDGKSIIAGSADGRNLRWNLQTGQSTTLYLHPSEAYATAVSRDGRYVASSSRDKDVTVYDSGTGLGKNYGQFHGDTVMALLFNPGGTVLYSTGLDGLIRSWPAKNGQLQQGQSIPVGEKVRSAAMDPAGTLIATGDDRGRLSVWRLPDLQREQVYQLGTRPVYGVAFTLNGREVCAGDSAGEFHRVNLETSQQTRWSSGSTIFGIAASPDGKLVARTQHPQYVELWDLDLNEVVGWADGCKGETRSTTFSPSGEDLAVCGGDGLIRIYSVATLAGRRPDKIAPLPRLFASSRSTDLRIRDRWLAKMFEEWPGRSGQVLGAAYVQQSNQLTRQALELEEAEKWQAALDLRIRKAGFIGHNRGMHSLDLAMELQRLYLNLANMGRRQEARAAVEWALEIADAARQCDPLEFTGSEADLVALLIVRDVVNARQDLGDYSTVEPLLHRCLAGYGTLLDRLAAGKRIAFEGSVMEFTNRDAVLGYVGTAGGLSRYHGMLNEWKTSETILEDAIKRSRPQLQDTDETLAILLNELSNVKSQLGDQGGQETLVRESLRILKALPDKSWSVRINAATGETNLGEILFLKGQDGEALTTLESALETYLRDAPRSFHHHQACMRLIADVHAKNKRFDQALKWYDKALETSQREPALALETAKNTLRRGLLRIGQNLWTPAMQDIDSSMRGLHANVAERAAGLSDLQQQSLTTSAGILNLKSALGIVQARFDNPEVADRTGEWLANWKGFTLRIRAHRALQSRLARDDRTRTQAAELAGARRRAAELADALRSTTDASLLNSLQSAFNRESVRERALSQEISTLVPELDEKWVSIDDIRSAIPKGAILIEYFSFFPYAAPGEPPTTEQLCAWIIPSKGADRARVIRLGNKAMIDAALVKVQGSLNDADRLIAELGEAKAELKVRTQLDDLSTLLLTPLLPELKKSSKWIVCPDTSLWMVPWSALSAGEGRFAIEQAEINLVSGSRELLIPQPANTLAAGPAVVVHSPEFSRSRLPPLASNNSIPAAAPADTGDPESAGNLPADEHSSPTVDKTATPDTETVHPGSSRKQWEAIRKSEEEAEGTITELTRLTGQAPRILTRGEATEEAIREAARPWAQVFISHGYYDLTSNQTLAQNPLLQCGIVLSGANDVPPADGDDGLLTGSEVLILDLRGTELVVLSACETGIGDVMAGAGVEGLVTAFRLAGARNVIASLWQVNDESTAILMRLFWANLKQPGFSKGAAIRHAQREFLRQQRENKRTTHPHYWAAFHCYGPG